MIRENQSIMSESALIAELEHTIAYGSDEKRLETLRQVTDLFMGWANLYSTEQIHHFEGAIRMSFARLLATTGRDCPTRGAASSSSAPSRTTYSPFGSPSGTTSRPKNSTAWSTRLQAWSSRSSPKRARISRPSCDRSWPTS